MHHIPLQCKPKPDRVVKIKPLKSIQSGTLTTYQSQCYVPCKNPIPLLGQCCPSCNACPRRNTKNGQEVVGFYPDPCISCHCFKGQMICKRKICPVLPCPQSKWYKAKHACCPICKGTEEVKQSIDSKSCLFNGKVLAEDDRFQYDKCTTCVCRVSSGWESHGGESNHRFMAECDSCLPQATLSFVDMCRTGESRRSVLSPLCCWSSAAG